MSWAVSRNVVKNEMIPVGNRASESISSTTLIFNIYLPKIQWNIFGCFNYFSYLCSIRNDERQESPDLDSFNLNNVIL